MDERMNFEKCTDAIVDDKSGYVAFFFTYHFVVDLYEKPKSY